MTLVRKGTVSTSADPGQELFTASGTFTVPTGVTEINVACIGKGGDGHDGTVIEFEGTDYPFGGGGGGGAGFCFKNAISVTPGEDITITINDTKSEFVGGGDDTIYANKGGDAASYDSHGVGGTAVAVGGTAHTGGRGGAYDLTGGDNAGGGGGAPASWGSTGAAGVDASQAGGSSNGGTSGGASSGMKSYPSGGMGIKVKGTSGAASSTQGNAGSNGTDGTGVLGTGVGGGYGGGGNGGREQAGTHGTGGPGAVRVVWGESRTYPDDSDDV